MCICSEGRRKGRSKPWKPSIAVETYWRRRIALPEIRWRTRPCSEREKGFEPSTLALARRSPTQEVRQLSDFLASRTSNTSTASITSAQKRIRSASGRADGTSAPGMFSTLEVVRRPMPLPHHPVLGRSFGKRQDIARYLQTCRRSYRGTAFPCGNRSSYGIRPFPVSIDDEGHAAFRLIDHSSSCSASGAGPDWPSRQRGDNLAVLVLGERAQRLGADVAQRADGEREPRDDFIARRVREDDGVVAALNEVERLDLGPHRAGELLGSLEPAGTLFDRLEALLCELQQCDVHRHVKPPALVLRAQHTPFEAHRGVVRSSSRDFPTIASESVAACASRTLAPRKSRPTSHYIGECQHLLAVRGFGQGEQEVQIGVF